MANAATWRMKAALVLALAPVVATLPTSPVLSDAAYPSRAIKVIVPIPPGAAADILPRIVSEKLAALWRHAVVIENRPGANSNLGAEAAAQAAPDGYTLLATPPPPLMVNQKLFAKVGFDPQAFVPVTILATITNVLVAAPNLPFSTLPEMIAYARAHPGALRYASAGVGSSPHLAMEWLADRAGVRMTHVPYNGLARALSDVAAGHVDMMFNNTFNVLPLLKDGKLKALGVTSAERFSELPDLPAIAEQYPGFVVTAWFAVVAPPGTPAPIAEKLSGTISDILREPDVSQRFRKFLAEPVGGNPGETAAFLERERERWARMLEAAALEAR
ncbi:MAG: Bug family tripartite tricarboxylate transporter substrate binding protein [Pseudorhodoplanes sp.]|uniref:Bug family tripartite tricarboxylate transporter substrate binding protein n=1 Tax=Pseudorhodoplanes sp. TaxID=1934341 RepID=UPI003D0D16F7